MSEEIRCSDIIEAFVNYCQEAVKSQQFHFNQVGECDRKTVDFNHTLELLELGYKDRARLTTCQTKNLKERRTSKDIVETLTPLKEFVTAPENSIFFNKLGQVLGFTRKIEKEKEQGARHYNFRSTRAQIIDNKIVEMPLDANNPFSGLTTTVSEIAEPVEPKEKIKKSTLTPNKTITQKSMTAILAKIQEEKQVKNESRKKLTRDKLETKK